MSIILFLIKHAPFWTVPVGIISAQFAYLYWLKDVRHISYALLSIVVFCLAVTAFYIFAGGPEKAPDVFLQIVSN